VLQEFASNKISAVNSFLRDACDELAPGAICDSQNPEGRHMAGNATYRDLGRG
jgi:hypothetical protein